MFEVYVCHDSTGEYRKMATDAERSEALRKARKVVDDGYINQTRAYVVDTNKQADGRDIVAWFSDQHGITVREPGPAW